MQFYDLSDKFQNFLYYKAPLRHYTETVVRLKYFSEYGGKQYSIL